MPAHSFEKFSFWNFVGFALASVFAIEMSALVWSETPLAEKSKALAELTMADLTNCQVGVSGLEAWIHKSNAVVYRASGIDGVMPISAVKCLRGRGWSEAGDLRGAKQLICKGHVSLVANPMEGASISWTLHINETNHCL